MKSVKLNRANIEVSKLGLGLMKFENATDHDHYVEILMYAFEKGINFFDTAELYSQDQSELIMGKAILEMKKTGKPFYISSKCLDGEPKAFRANLERTLKRLNLDSIDFYTPLWGVKSYLDLTEAEKFGAIKEMEKAKSEGLIKHMSITTHMKNDDLEKVVRDYPFDINIVSYNAISHNARHGGIKASHESGISNIIMNPLAHGMVFKYCDLFENLKIRENQTIASAAYDFALSSPYADVVLSGLYTKEHIDEAVNAVDNHKPYTEEEIALVQNNLREAILKMPLEKRYEIAWELCDMMFILRDEVAEFLNVYPMKIWRRNG